MVICDKNDGKDKMLVWAKIYSAIFELPGGIHIGNSIDDLLKQYPCKEIDFDPIEDEAYFYITNYSNFKKSYNSLYVFVKSNDKTRPIITDGSTDKSKNFHTNGVVDFFYIHK